MRKGIVFIGSIIVLFLLSMISFAESQTYTLIHDGLERVYRVYVPQNYDPDIPLPMIFAFHGGGGNAEGAEYYFDLNEKADQEGFIVVYPQGTGKVIAGKSIGGWYAGKCCGKEPGKVDDVGFIRALIDQVKIDYAIDEKRIFATGMSNGAMMCYALACEMSDVIAAIAPSGAHDTELNCHPSRPVPIIHFHGKDDPCASYEGGACGGCSVNFIRSVMGLAQKDQQLWECSSVPEYIDRWRIRNQCSNQTRVVYQNNDATCFEYEGCKDQADVVLCSVENMGHVWPGRTTYGVKACQHNVNGYVFQKWKNIVGELNADINANDEMWTFFQAHPLK